MPRPRATSNLETLNLFTNETEAVKAFSGLGALFSDEFWASYFSTLFIYPRFRNNIPYLRTVDTSIAKRPEHDR